MQKSINNHEICLPVRGTVINLKYTSPADQPVSQLGAGESRCIDIIAEIVGSSPV